MIKVRASKSYPINIRSMINNIREPGVPRKEGTK